MSVKKLIERMNILAKTNKMEQAVATSMLAITSDRIFTQGRAADNAELGQYSDAYMKLRTGKVLYKGKKLSWTNSRKVILQMTGQMHQDFSVIIEGDALGLGFKNEANLAKSFAVEQTYKKDIFKHTDQEKEQLNKLIEKEVNKILNG